MLKYISNTDFGRQVIKLKVKVYTSKICPRCKVLKTKLQNANIDFDEISGDDAVKAGISEVPVMEVDGKRMYFSESIHWIQNMEGKNAN